MRKELLFSSLLLLGSLGCNPNQEVGKSVNGETKIQPEPDLEHFMRTSPEFREIYEKIRQKDQGLVLLLVDYADFTIWARLARVDVLEANRTDSNLQEIQINAWIAPSGQPRPTTNYFVATSCSGEYRIDISTDGVSYQSLSIPDLQTGQPRETFRLRPSCTRPVTFTVR